MPCAGNWAGAGCTDGTADSKGQASHGVGAGCGHVPAFEGKIHADTFTLVHGDALKEDLAALVPCGPAAVVANLPYYVTTPILMRLLQELPLCANHGADDAKEVAQRLCAAPGSKIYGSLSIAVQYHAEVETVLKVSPASFSRSLM